jgi:hypothetical protein
MRFIREVNVALLGIEAHAGRSERRQANGLCPLHGAGYHADQRPRIELDFASVDDAHRLVPQPPGATSRRSVGLDNFRYGHAEVAVVDDHHLAARDQAVIDVDIDRLTKFAVKFDDGAAF